MPSEPRRRGPGRPRKSESSLSSLTNSPSITRAAGTSEDAVARRASLPQDGSRRTAPRASFQPAATLKPKDTPQALLRQVSKALNISVTRTPDRPMSTPVGAARVDGRPSSRNQTPGTASKLLRPIRSSRATVSTPHGKFAMEQRRLNTPARLRRQSGRPMRESPRDILRQLAQKMAPKSKPIIPSPDHNVPSTLSRENRVLTQRRSDRASVEALLKPHADDDVDERPPRPTLDLYGDSDDEDSNHRIRPRLSFPADDISIRSIEQAVREAPETLADRRGGRISSFGFPIRSSDEFDEITFPEVSGFVSADDFLHSQGLELDSINDSHLPLEDIGFPDDNADFTISNRDDEDPTITAYLDNSVHLNDSFHGPSHAKGRWVGRRVVRVEQLSRFGIPYPSFPQRIVKRVAQTFLAPKDGRRGASISNEVLRALATATDSFFKQASEDLKAYSSHGGRKTIEEVDVVQLMKRQRIIGNQMTPFAAAQAYLPQELVREIRMPAKRKPRTSSSRGLRIRKSKAATREGD